MLTFTDRALEMVRSFIDQSDGELPYLRISADGSPLSPRFELTLVSEDERVPDERAIDLDDFTVLVAESQADRLEGATVDFVERVNESGFEVRPRPNGAGREKPAGPPSERGPEGPIAERVRQVLDTQVNPAIASHGGAITLVDVQDSEVFVEMTGGCQGCAMSRLTLRQGVERMLRQAVPELTAVHDVTDHASGSNPFYQAPV
jgi:Fe/S biogenesis protein NfuA